MMDASPGPSLTTHPTVQVVTGWALLTIAALIIASPRVGDLGLYYDEAFLAQQARDFVEPGRGADAHPPSIRSIELFGRPFPTRNAAYLGSLKSQLLIPALFVFGSSVEVVRIATLCTGLLAVLFGMLFAARVFGVPIALLTGALVVSDPSFVFFSQFEWGPFTTNLLCRCVGLWAVVAAWPGPGERPGPRQLALAGLGGLAFGLGVFSRADFVLILAGLATGVLLGHPRLAREALTEQRALCLSVGGALVLAAAPMLLSVAALFGSTAAVSDRGDFLFRLDVLRHALDGSQFHRVIAQGGLFESAAEAAAPSGLLGYAFIAALAILAFATVRSPRDARDPRRFLVIATATITIGMLALPGAVRAHHQLNVLPLSQLVVASAIAFVWNGIRRPLGRWSRALAIAATFMLLVANAVVIARTYAEIERTGGKGRFSHALSDLARALEAEPGSAAVSLDWGFNEPLLFLTDRVVLEEAIWSLPVALRSGRPWVYEGDARTRYLVHDAPYDLFGLGPLLLEMARSQPEGSVIIEPHRDRAGETAFYVARIPRPHRLAYTGRFVVEDR